MTGGVSAIRLATASATLTFCFVLGTAPAHAGFRASFDPLTVDSRVFNRYETASLRPRPAADGVERYFTFTTRSPVVGREGSREIWLHRNLVRAGINLPDISDARLPLLRDPSGAISYLDPAWSPDGRYMAYIRTDPTGSRPTVYVQEFQVSEVIAEAVTPIGSPILVIPGADGVAQRNPKWSPDGMTLAFQSTASGRTYDIWTVDVFPSVGVPVRRTDDDFHGEQEPAWSPDGTRIAYTTTFFGPEILAIVDLTTPQPHEWAFVEPDAAPVYHRNPSWSPDGTALYYHAPKNEDQNQLPDIWRFDLSTRAKCAISIDLTADSDVDVSEFEHSTPDGIPFNYFLFTSMGGSPTFQGPNIWRGQLVYNCVPPLPMGADVQPNTLQVGSGGKLTVTLSFPPETIAAGYQCSSFDGPLEGVRLRNTVIASPTIEGIAARPDPATGNVFPIFTDRRQGGQTLIDVTWDRKELETLLIERGLFGKNAPLKIQAYSNLSGRAFQGFAYVKLVAGGSAASGALRLRQNEPNPFRGGTSIRFAASSAGRVAVRVFNARGQLVRVVADEWFPAGANAVTWDGRDDRGRETPSGIYYAQATGSNGVRDRVKMLRVR